MPKVEAMKVGYGAYGMLAKMYRDKANDLRAAKVHDRESLERAARMLDDAAADYEATAKAMS